MEHQKNNSDTLLVLVVAWMLLSRVFWFIIPKVFASYFESYWFPIVNGVLTLIWACIPFVIAFAIKDKNKQQLSFVCAGIYMLFNLYEIAQSFSNSNFSF